MTIAEIGSMHELQFILIFGIGTLVLYLLVPVALFANEVRLAKQSDDTSGTASIFNSLLQAFYYITAWSMLVTVIMFMVVSYKHDVAKGIEQYWKIEWIKSATDNAKIPLDPSEFKVDTTQRDTAKAIVLILTWAEVLEYLLLGVLLMLTLKLTMSLPLFKARRADHYKMTTQVDLGSMFGALMAALVGWTIFTVILSLESKLITAIVEKGLTGSDHEIDILDGLKAILKTGIETIEKYNG